MVYIRKDGRSPEKIRPLEFIPRYIEKAYSSCLVKSGATWVICSTTLIRGLPSWKESEGGGWLTAEYDMLPASSGDGRAVRDRVRGQVSGRSQEIQRLIGRALRAITNLTLFDDYTLWVDADVLQADGGTRTASINGSIVALYFAFSRMKNDGLIKSIPLMDFAGAVSVGMVEGMPLVDLNFEEDSRAEVDMNIVMTRGGEIIEIQGTAEKKTFNRDMLNTMIDMAEKAIKEIIKKEIKAIGIEK